MRPPLPSEWSAWLDTGARLLAAPPLRRNEHSTPGHIDPKFALGDFLVGVPSAYVDLLAEALQREPERFREYREVAEKIPPGARVAASWTVHRDLRDYPQLLRDGLTVRGAAALLNRRPFDSPAEHNLPVEVRAKRVRERLADPEVYAVIDEELARGRAERQLRRRARHVQSEYARRARELEGELLELRTAKSATEATVQAELEVNKAIQYIEAIGQTLQELPHPERLLAALRELNEATAAVLLANTPDLEASEGPVVIEGEVWQTRSARAAYAGSNQRALSGEGRIVVDHFD
jgi:hypothetical protein